MESLLEALYAYAMENRIDAYLLRDTKERQDNEKMIRLTMEKLAAQGMGDMAQRVEAGYTTLGCLDRRGAFWAGLTIGLELNRL